MRLTSCLDCHRAVSPGPRCSDCQRIRNRQYDAARPAYHGVYQTPDWRRLSAQVRAEAERCHWCLAPLAGRRSYADHIIPVEQRPDLALERANVVAACNGCNVRRGRNAQRAVTYRQVSVDELVARAKRSALYVGGRVGNDNGRDHPTPEPIPVAKLPESSTRPSTTAPR